MSSKTKVKNFIPPEQVTTDIGVVIAGNVDVGKSSTIGVLYSGKLDNGNGSARQCVARHKHELEKGKTSDISTKTLYFGNGKALCLIDLCGHMKYLKTTTFGITGHFPDYAIVMIAANNGIQEMTKEHIGILFYMQIPTVFLITRADIAPTEIYNNTIRQIKAICKYYNKTCEFINSLKEFGMTEHELHQKEQDDGKEMKRIANSLKSTTDFIPVLTTSNKTGYYISALKTLLKELEPRKLWESNTSESVFYIDSIFNPPGIGLVVSGINKGKSIQHGDNLYIGPIANTFIPIKVKSLHNNCRQIISELKDHDRGCIAFSNLGELELSKSLIHRGMIVGSSDKMKNNLCFRFKAQIEILHHSATIGVNYAPVIHLGSIRQTVRILKIEDVIFKKSGKEVDSSESHTIQTGDKAIVEFKFKTRSEFVEPGMTFFLREGKTKGVGKILEIYSLTKDDKQDPFKIKKNRKNKKSRELKLLK